MTSLLTAVQDDRFYPSSDGKPMAENTERQEKERLAAYLRSLGLDPDQLP